MGQRRRIRFAATPALLVLLSWGISGCLVSEVSELHCVFDSEEGVWTVTHTDWNLGSDREAYDQQTEDFNQLIHTWRDDGFLLDMLDQGYATKRRNVWVEKDKICSRFVYLTRQLPRDLKFNADSTSIEYHGGQTQLLTTNGKADPDSPTVFIRWPAGIKEFHVKERTVSTLHPFSREKQEEIYRLGGKKPKD